MDTRDEVFEATRRLVVHYDDEGWQSITFHNQTGDTPASVRIGVDAHTLDAHLAHKQQLMERAGIVGLVSDITFLPCTTA